jgi:uncharacterized iron-regulated membrane protein
MTTADSVEADMTSRDRLSAALYRTIWRWHFYAGLFCIPFVIWLATTGSIYLFKPQIEALIDRPYDQLALTGQRATAEAQVAAALAAVPGSRFRHYELPQTPHSAIRVIVARKTSEIRVYVNPETLKVLKIVPEESRLMRIIFKLHGELLLGNRGSIIVELAASWTIVMIVTGLYLWWPRRARGLAGIVYPRLTAGGRTFWRDLHAVTGLWVSAFALFILLSGLPWAKSWGSYLNEIRHITGTAAGRPDWPIGGAPSTDDMSGMPGMGDMSGMSDMSGMAMRPTASAAIDYGAIDRILATIAPLDLAFPVLISPPKTPGGNWTAKSDAQNRPLRTDLTLDGRSGAILTRKDFDQRHLIDRIVAIGVAAHEGQLFGWANQLLSLATAMGLILMSVGAVVLWWGRRAVGVLGAPPAPQILAGSIGLVALMIGFGLALPLLGVSMIAVGLTDRLVLRRIPRIRDWLGLRTDFA